MRTKYPSGHRKSTPTVPITPFQLQNCSFIHHSTASLTDLLESTAETPHTPQICLQRPISGWIRPLSCVRNTLQATANRHQPLPQPVMLTERRIYGLTKGLEVVRQTNRVSKKGSRLARESFGESPRFFLPQTGLFQFGRSQCTYRTESNDRINTRSAEAEAKAIAIVSNA